MADGGAEDGREGGGNGSTVDFDVLNSFFMTPRSSGLCDTMYLVHCYRGYM